MIRYSKPFLLSNEGSDRGSAYNFSNKSVTIGDKTHVIWTDAIAVTRGRTFDHTTQQWGDTFTIGEGVDNHNSPCLTADSRGRLHVAYGPHNAKKPYADGFPGGAFKYAVAGVPGTLKGLDQTAQPFGLSGTYPCLLNSTRGNDVIVYRGDAEPRTLIFQRRNDDESWTAPKALMRQDVPPQYTHVGAITSCAAAGTLYVAGHFYAMKRDGSIGCAILQSTDNGDTWTDLRGKVADVPVQYGERFAVPHAPAALDPRVAGLDIDKQGRPWVLTAGFKLGAKAPLLSHWEGNAWRTIDLHLFAPGEVTLVGDGLTIDTAGRIHVLCTAFPTDVIANEPKQRWWSHKLLEVVHLVSRDGGTSFSYHSVSPPDAEVANWLPSLSRSGPFHPVEKPVIVWTHGMTGQFSTTGDKCRPETRTEIYCVRVEEIA